MTPGPIEVTFGRIEHWSRPQALVVTTAGEPAAARALAEALKAAAVAAGFTPDLKPFRAHVTVARKVLRAPSLPQLAPLRWCCGSFALIDSRSEAGAPVYSVVESHTLDNGEKADK
jgi:2'-5' RNA ligase